jgi:hypothetical protein
MNQIYYGLTSILNNLKTNIQEIWKKEVTVF